MLLSMTLLDICICGVDIARATWWLLLSYVRCNNAKYYSLSVLYYQTHSHHAWNYVLTGYTTHVPVWRQYQYSSVSTYTRSIMNVSRARFTHSRQNGTLAESRSEEGSLTGSSAQPDTWRIPHSSPPFQPGTHNDRAITACGEGPRPAVFRPIC